MDRIPIGPPPRWRKPVRCAPWFLPGYKFHHDPPDLSLCPQLGPEGAAIMRTLRQEGFKTRIRLVGAGWRVCPSCRALCWPRLVAGKPPHVCDPKRRHQGGFEATMPMPSVERVRMEHEAEKRAQARRYGPLTLPWPALMLIEDV